MIDNHQTPQGPSEWKKYVQFILVIGFLLAAARLGWIYWERREAEKPPEREAAASTYNLTDDDYVVLPKSYAYDVPSARKELGGKVVWVRAGNQLVMYATDPASHRADFGKEQGVLPPLDKLTVRDIVLQKAPKSDHQILAIVEHADGRLSAVPAGAANANGTNLYLNDIFFYSDPHTLYKHWPADSWAAVDRHEVKPGMSELQAVFALGAGRPTSGGTLGDRTIEFPNNGHPITVTFTDNKATQISSNDKDQK